MQKIKQYVLSRFSLNELSGSFGDFGTLVPITISMTKKNVLQPCVSFFWGGIANIIAGLYWDVPMPVQPMKTIATAVGNNELTTAASVAIAGLLTGSTAFVLGVFDVIRRVNKYIPKSSIAIVQCVTGIGLAQNGFTLINNLNLWVGIDSYLTAMLASCIVLLNFTNNPYKDRIPSALLLFIIGCILAVLLVNQNGGFLYGFVHPFTPLSLSYSDDWKTGFLAGALAQLPLTLLNSVIAICDLTNQLFEAEIKDGQKNTMTIRSTTISLGLVNVACVFGGIPTCHGSGGLAGQYKFGARNGLSVVMLGIMKVIIGLAGGLWFNTLLKWFPNSILGILLFICGAELTKYGLRYVKQDGFIVASGVAIGLASKIWIGFLVGLVLHYIRFDKINEQEEKTQKKEELSVLPNASIELTPAN